jgi:hypothetical protein
MSNLRLDQKTSAMRVIVPGKSAESRLVRMVSGAETKVMPPMGAKLTDAEIASIRKWIDAGAEWSAGSTAASPAVHWSFQPIRRPDLPAVSDAKWARNDIDRFILAKLDSEKIKPSPEAARTTLLRRMMFDLTGLPPTPREVSEFLADTRPDAYERMVDRALASPHFGEKWARWWLDLARYADSDGYEKDRSRPFAWRYRNWVIEAFNRNLPFDQFTTQQLAGDLMPDHNTETLVATGFNRNTLTNREGGTDPEQFRDEQVLDRAATLGTVWLGLTVGCAQCHNHKYDPILQKEFYQLSAFFNTEEEANVPAPLAGEEAAYRPAKAEYDQARKALFTEYKVYENEKDWEEKLRYASEHPGEHDDWSFAYGEFTHNVDNAHKVLYMDPAKRAEIQQDQMYEYFLRSCGNLYPKQHCADLKVGEAKKKWDDLVAKLPPYAYAPILRENDTPPKTYIHIKGDWREHGEEVHPGTLHILPPMPAGPVNRLTLAKWLMEPENPLPARVAVNRLWQEVFGRGIVFTSDDFGTTGDKPTHPELLDWLASEFRGRQWDMKQMIRLMVTSATYRQSSDARPELKERDPENTLLARQSRLRLPAESVRDNALSAAGLLDLRIGGPSIKPPQPKGVAELSYGGSVKWVESTGADRYRRGLYIHFQRTVPYPQLINFDAPTSNVSCTRRARTNSPLQALNLLNDPVFYDAAQALGRRIQNESQGSFRDRLTYAYHVTLGRDPSPRELDRLSRFANEPDGWVAISRVLLNLDEFITRE